MGYNVIVLCAGIGERLRPYTNKTNKSLLDINGKPLIIHFLDILYHTWEVNTTHIVIGHYGHKFRKLISHSWYASSTRFHENQLFKITGAAQSLYTVSDVLRRGPCVVLEGDHYLDPRLMQRLMKNKQENVVLVDEDLSRLKYDEEVIAYGYQGVVEHLQWPSPYPENPIGEALTIFKLGKDASRDLAAILENYLLEDGKARREIIEPLNRLMEMHDLHYELTGGLQWIEIDTEADLEKARNMKFGDDAL